MGLGGCLTLYDYPAVVKRLDSQAYPVLTPGQVYFFISKEAFPPDLQAVPLATLYTPQGSQWSDSKLIAEFQAGAAAIGANAVIFESIQKNPLDVGFLYYTGYATAYRLYKNDPQENIDLSSSQYGTQTPDLTLVK